MPQPVTSYYCPGSLDTSAIFAIFIASLRAVSCAGAIVVAGLWMARRGVLTRGLSKGLSQFSVKLAIPCLLFTSVVPGVSPSLLAYGWPLLLLPAVYLLLGTLLGLPHQALGSRLLWPTPSPCRTSLRQ